MLEYFTKILTIAATLAALGFSATPAAARSAGPDCEAAQAAVKADIDASCPCSRPGNHGEYVRCVTKKLRELSACSADESGKRSCGPVPRQCAGKIRRLASRSACGKSASTVTCCVPKQRDCEGDANPGDGRQDGTCTGTKRTCDRVTDCMVPKCEMAASAERCGVLGGTVGSGRDCTTACAP